MSEPDTTDPRNHVGKEAIRLRTPGQEAWRRFRQNRLAVWSAWFLAAVVLAVLVWPLARLSPVARSLPDAMTWPANALSEDQFTPPTGSHWFGTDVHGRDLLSRVLYGARISLLIGVVGAAVSLLIGVLWGASAGYLGGRWDGAMMRVVDVLYSLPSIVFVIVLISTVEVFLKETIERNVSAEQGGLARLLLLFAGLGAVSWLTMARIVRGQVLSLRTRQFVEASRVLGAGTGRILFCHILPNVAGTIIVYLTLTVPAVILYESFLSFLGLGIQPPRASLGYLIADGAGSINPVRVYWWLIVFPGVFLAGTLMALNFLGDGLRDAWDTRTREP